MQDFDNAETTGHEQSVYTCPKVLLN